jgi:hypothetical protein
MTAKPALRLKNPNPNGVHLIKFDEAMPNESDSGIELMTYRTRLPLWSKAARRNLQREMERIAEALRQNPDYTAVLVFPKLPAVAAALAFIEACGLKGRISAGLYTPS